MDERQKRPSAPDNWAETTKTGVSVEVNTKQVVLTKHRVSGLEIKRAAVDQGVPHVTVHFQLIEIGKGNTVRGIADTQIVTVTKKSKFRMTAPDDNSGF